MKKTSQFIALLAMMVFSFTLLPAQGRGEGCAQGQHQGPQGHHQFGRHGHHGMNAEQRAWFEANALPVLREAREDLDQKISPEDRATIAGLRSELQALRPQIEETSKVIHTAKRSGTEPDDEMRTRMQAQRAQHREIMEQAGAIARRYEGEMQRIREELHPLQEAWHQEMRALGGEAGHGHPHGMEHGQGKACSPGEGKACAGKGAGQQAGQPCGGNGQKGEGRGHGHGHGKGHGEGEGHRGEMGHRGHPGHRGMLMDAKFILLDPAGSMDRVMMGEAAEGPGMEVFPNPAMDRNTIRYEVVKDGPVRIDLLNQQGQLVRTLVQEDQSAGMHDLKVDTENLPNSTYFYKVTQNGESRTQRFSIVK